MVSQITLHAQSASALLNSASSSAIETTLSRISGRFRHWSRWLTVRHPYTDVVRVLHGAHKNIDGVKLSEYIASSMPLHLMDGWVFLARAFDCVKQGDHNTAAHLGYYAELRAAMSLLASEGIGIFRSRHVAISSTFIPTDWTHYKNASGKKRPAGTHIATWQLLDSLSIDSTRAARLLETIFVESRSIKDWFDAANVTSQTEHRVARDWLSTWSLDLKMFGLDQILRNRVSYRPSRISPKSSVALNLESDVIDPILRTWDALEPTVDRGGAVIDQILLYRALRLASNQGTSAGWERFVDRLGDVASTTLLRALKTPADNESYVLNLAGNRTNPPQVPALLARATMLLRLANGACALRLQNANVTKADLMFWWQRFGEDSGLWSDEAETEPFSNLWAVVTESLIDAQESLDSLPPPMTMPQIAQIFTQGVSLTQYPRAPLWLLGVD